MIRKSFDLGVISALALVALALTMLGVKHVLPRLLLGLPLVLVLPGYALMAAIFPKRALDSADRLLLSLGVSVGVTILGGFVLNMSPWGLQTDSWAALLTYITLGGSLVAFARRRFAPGAAEVAGEQEHGRKTGAVGRPTIALSAGQALLFGLAAVVIVGAVMLARSEAAQHPASGVIQLWILPGDQADPNTFRLGVNSVEPAAGTFRLQLERDGYGIREWPSLAITAGQKWEETVKLHGRQPGNGPIEARLYRLEQPSIVYRRVALWLGGTS